MTHKNKMMGLATITALMVPVSAICADSPKMAIAAAVQEVISEKEKPFRKDPGSIDGSVQRICGETEAISCHVYNLAPRKLNKRIVKVSTVFGKTCESAGGRVEYGEPYPAGSGIDAYFQRDAKFPKPIGNYNIVEKTIGCWLNETPEIIFRAVSMQRTPNNQSDAMISLVGDKASLYIMLHDMDKMRKSINDAATIQNTNDDLAQLKKNNYEACMAGPVDVGQNSQFGLVIEKREAVSQVQGPQGVQWVKTQDLKLSSSEC